MRLYTPLIFPTQFLFVGCTLDCLSLSKTEPTFTILDQLAGIFGALNGYDYRDIAHLSKVHGHLSFWKFVCKALKAYSKEAEYERDRHEFAHPAGASGRKSFNFDLALQLGAQVRAYSFEEYTVHMEEETARVRQENLNIHSWFVFVYIFLLVLLGSHACFP